ncbi:MAG: 7-carboxy-7-deazaguanine synthase [Acidobacteriota bacterium]
MYFVKEIYYTLQGEGAQTGRAAVFCRFTGCNLWSGHEQDRTTALCNFCDTDFVGTDGPGGGRFEQAGDLASTVASHWPRNSAEGRPLVVCTGGEPLLQLDEKMISAFHALRFEVAIETNGTRVAPEGVDWICVSPKPETKLLLRTGNELKLVYPQVEAMPELFASLAFEHFFLQPMDGADRELNTQRAIEYCLAHPKWRLSLQTHKLIGIP